MPVKVLCEGSALIAKDSSAHQHIRFLAWNCRAPRLSNTEFRDRVLTHHPIYRALLTAFFNQTINHLKRVAVCRDTTRTPRLIWRWVIDGELTVPRVVIPRFH